MDGNSSILIGELLDVDGRLALAADVDERHLRSDRDDRPFDRLPLVEPLRLQRGLEHPREIVVLIRHGALLSMRTDHCMLGVIFLREPSSVRENSTPDRVLRLLVGLAAAASADEGMWMPQQVPALADRLRAAGFEAMPSPSPI
jgi:hypothetical protein